MRYAWAGASVGVAALAGVYHLDPHADSLILCPYRALTGFACPGCGMTRAVHFLLHGDIATAWTYNPLLFLAVPLAAAFALAPLTLDVSRASRHRTTIGWTALALTLVFWIWRNTGAYPWLRL